MGVYTYNPAEGPATVEEMDPTEGPYEGGTPVHLFGTGLNRRTEVTFVGTAGLSPSGIGDHLVVTTPRAPAAGPAEVVVAHPEEAVIAGHFVYAEPPAPDAPQVISSGPMFGPIAGGTLFTITGLYLDDTTSVAFGDVPATELTTSFGLVTCRTPLGPPAPRPSGWRHTGPATLLNNFCLSGSAPEPEVPTERCRRKAWLTLGTRELDLEDLAAGYACLGLPISVGRRCARWWTIAPTRTAP